MPRVDQTFVAKRRQVLLELIPILLVVVGVGEEEFGHVVRCSEPKPIVQPTTKGWIDPSS
jgi:hypothetical protein